MIDWADKETFWLNVTNAVLGLVTLVAFAAVIGSAASESLERAWKRLMVAVKGVDPHTLHVPELGSTMADGGEEKTDDDEGEDQRQA